MTPAPTCPECGAALPPDARRGLCPRCLLQSASNPAPAEETIHLVLADGQTEPLPFRDVGDYELIAQLGHGGMGIIFKARQKSLDRMVALKLVRAGSLARPDDIARFRTEAAAAARLEHPHIVAIYEVGEHEGRPFYSMEYVAGRSLAEALREGPFPPDRAAELIRKVAVAIQFAHEHGILHRDLKPSNILIDENQEPRVADFGLAKILQHDSELTLSGAIIGSPGYMPPEQARGSSAQANVRSDVYSLGAMLYEMMTGRPPFAAATPLEIMKLVVEQDPIPPRALNPLLPRDLETICLKCLAKEPAARYASATELAEELGRFLRDEPIHARPAGALERTLRWYRRNPALATLAVVLILTPAIIISVLLVMGNQVALQRNRALAQERSTAQNLYAVDIALAFKALDEEDYNLAWHSLAAHLPGDQVNGSEDLRGFEWRWLWERAQGGAKKTFAEHFAEIMSIDWSRDGRFIASASLDGSARIWDPLGMKCAYAFPHPDAPSSERRVRQDLNRSTVTAYMFSGVSFSSDSRELITGVGKRGLGIWETGSVEMDRKINTNGQNVALFSPVDPDLALTYCLYPRTSMGILDVRSMQVINYFTNGRADTVCFTPDGRRFARWDREAHKITLQTIPDGQTLCSVDAPGIYAASMTFTPDGKVLAVGNLNGRDVELFDIASGKGCGRLTGHTGRILAVAISPDGKKLASGGFDQTIRLWDLPARREIRKLQGHRAAVSGLVFSPDGSRLASGGFDGTVRLWDVATPPPPPAITNVSGPFVFSTDGRWLVTQSTNGRARLWATCNRQLTNEWQTVPFTSAVILTNGTLLSTCFLRSNEPARICFHNLTNGLIQTVVLRGGPESGCTAMTVSPDGRFAVTAHTDGTIAFWDAPSGRLLHLDTWEFKFLDKRSQVDSLAISADGGLLLAVSYFRVAMRTWAMHGFKPLGTQHLGAAYPMNYAISPDGKQIAASGNGQGLVINVWDAELLGPPLKLSGQADFLNATAFAPDCRTLVAAGIDGQLRLWHLPTERELGTLMTLPRDVRFSHLAFSPDGSWLGVSDTTGELHLFRAPVPAEN